MNSIRNLRIRRLATVVAVSLVMLIGLSATPASAKAPRWVYVGKETFTIDYESAVVPTYVNTNSIVGDRSESYTVTFQARFKGRNGINRVNVGVIVDCLNYEAYADQFIVYYTKGSDDYDQYDGGELSPRITSRALSYCY